jgi:ABC-type antimicrobial peptide transport system permease subunit
VIVSRSFERAHYGNRSALGQTIFIQKGRTTTLSARVVGVARDAGYDRMLSGQGSDLRNLDDEMLYQPTAQYPFPMALSTLVVRTTGDPMSIATSVRHLADDLPLIHVERVSGIGQLLDDAASRERFAAALATSFGALALMLTAVGVFGSLWFHVTQRTKEIGIRMALGAQAADAVRLVLRQTLVMATIAVAFGVPLALACAWMVRAQLYGVKPADPLALIGAAALLTATAIAASVIPSRRAALVDPLIALREEG